jgi:hypothetical protein
MPDGIEREMMEVEYEIMKIDTRECLRKDQYRLWLKITAKAAANMKSNPKKAWKHWSKMGNWQGRKEKSGPNVIRDSNGVMLTKPEDIGKAWSDHYQRLAEDQSGRSQDREFWSSKVEEWDFPHLESLDVDFEMDELLKATARLRDHKCPGEDGIVGEWMKAMLHGESGDDTPSVMAQVVLRLFNTVWRSNYIPKCWREAVVISLHKKGDPMDMDNYRGISLMAVPLKVLLLMLTHRIERTLERNSVYPVDRIGR